jgi:hypothetical protein
LNATCDVQANFMVKFLTDSVVNVRQQIKVVNNKLPAVFSGSVPIDYRFGNHCDVDHSFGWLLHQLWPLPYARHLMLTLSLWNILWSKRAHIETYRSCWGRSSGVSARFSCFSHGIHVICNLAIRFATGPNPGSTSIGYCNIRCSQPLIKRRPLRSTSASVF